MYIVAVVIRGGHSSVSYEEPNSTALNQIFSSENSIELVVKI